MGKIKTKDLVPEGVVGGEEDEELVWQGRRTPAKVANLQGLRPDEKRRVHRVAPADEIFIISRGREEMAHQ